MKKNRPYMSIGHCGAILALCAFSIGALVCAYVAGYDAAQCLIASAAISAVCIAPITAADKR